MSMISSLAEYAQQIESVCTSWDGLSTTTHPWFRGQSDASWELLPSLYREGENPHFEREMFRDFKLRALAFLQKAPTNDIEWLFIMQHYGMPTRLLDWTESHLAALYFAVSDHTSTRDAAVWILDPWSLNCVSVGVRSVPTSNHPDLEKYTIKLSDEHAIRHAIREVAGEMPVALRPSRNMPRIVAQKGTFTIHGRQTKSLDQIATDTNASAKISGSREIRLTKLTIPGQNRIKILKQLFLAGLSHSLLFPDLDGLSKEIRFRYSRQYMGCNSLSEESESNFLGIDFTIRRMCREIWRILTGTSSED